MKLTWSFTAKKLNGKAVTGLVVSENAVFAMARVKKMGFSQPIVSFALWESFSTGFGLFMPNDFNLREKSRFYETTSKRLQTGGTLKDAMESAKDYLDDGRLVSAVSIAAAAQDGGEPAWRAMEIAGFPRRDVMVIKALALVGNLKKAFMDLSQEAKLRDATEKAVNSAMRKPLTMVLVFYAVLPLIFGFLGPQMLKLFKKLGSGIRIPDDVQIFYSFVEVVNNAPIFWTVVWLGLGVGCYLTVKSELLVRVRSKIKVFRDLDMKSEHVQLWTVYGLMYSANISPQEICNTLRSACKLTSTADSLYIMSRRLGAGVGEVAAIESAGFPRFVTNGYRAAKDTLNLPEGLKSFCAMLQEDVVMLTEQVKDVLEKLSLLISVLVLAAVFYVTYYPVAGPILQNL